MTPIRIVKAFLCACMHPRGDRFSYCELRRVIADVLMFIAAGERTAILKEMKSNPSEAAVLANALREREEELKKWGS
jgi:hypothetical protein